MLSSLKERLEMEQFITFMKGSHEVLNYLISISGLIAIISVVILDSIMI